MSRPPTSFPWRGVMVGLLVEVPTIFWVAASEVTARVFISSWSLTMTAVVWLLFLLLVNAGLTRWAPRLRLSRVDLLVVFTMLSTTSVIYGYSLLQAWAPSLGGADWWATPQNRWADLVRPLLPDWAVISDERALTGLFEGNATPPWQMWLPRMLNWGGFLLAAYAATLGLCLLLARQWIAHERLTFPICTLPLEMTTDRWPVLRSRLMWLGFAIPLVLESLLALRHYFPVVPAVQMKHQLHPEWFPNAPWSVMRITYFGWTPFIVGLAYVAPTEISFSCWFFVLFNLALRVLGALFGWTDPTGSRAATDFPYLVETTTGAFIAFALCALWMARGHLVETLRAAAGLVLRGGESIIDESERPVYRLATALLLLGTAGIIAFCRQIGISAVACLGVFTAYFLVAITLSRLRAEAGPAWAFGPDRKAHELAVWLFGSGAFDRSSLGGMGLLTWFFADVRFAVLPAYMEGLKVGDEARIERRHLAIIILLGSVVAIFVGMVAILWQYYQLGAATAKTYGAGRWISQLTGQTIERWLTLPQNPDWPRIGMTAVGGVVVTGLHLMRQRVLWWPFHPVGYVMAHTGAGYSFVCHYFIAWLAKTLVLKMGGMRLYRQSLPFVVGLILGDITTQTVWSLVATLAGWPVYQFIS